MVQTSLTHVRYGDCQHFDIVKSCGFSVFSSAIEAGGSVRAITAKNAAAALTRKEIDKLTEYVKGIGAKGLAYTLGGWRFKLLI